VSGGLSPALAEPRSESAGSPRADQLTALLLAREDVQRELGLTAAQRDDLKVVKQEFQAVVQELAEELNRAGAEEKTHLRKSLAEFRKHELSASLMVLSKTQLARLQEVYLQALGPGAAFLPEMRERLDVSAEQVERYRKLCAQHRQAIFEDFRQQPLEKLEADSLARLRRIQRQRRAELDRQILDTVLSRTQRDTLQRLQGRTIGFDIDLYQAGPALQAFKTRLEQPVPRLLEPYSIFVLVRIPLVLDLLGIAPEERRAIVGCAEDWKRTEEAFYKGLEGLDQRQQVQHINRWALELPKQRAPAEEKLARLLGAEAFQRLKEIELQLRGAGAVFGTELKQEFRITPEQHREMLRAFDRANREHAELTWKQIEAGERPDPWARFMNLHAAHERALLAVLTVEQKAQWGRRIGQQLNERTHQALTEAAARLQDSRTTPRAAP
jgi:hypothetical protein